MEFIGGIFLLLSLGLILHGVMIVCQTVVEAFVRRVTRDWPMIEAVISQCDIRDVSDSESISHELWMPITFYSYQVNDVPYWGSVRLSAWETDHKGALEKARELVGKTLNIRYKPANPGKSVFLQRDNFSLVLRQGMFRRLLWLCFG
jgi:hypothetical protein